MTVGKILKNLREQEGMSQNKLAQSLGLTTSAYGYYEQDRTKPTLDTLRSIADYYDVSVDYLLGRANNPKLSGLQNIGCKLIQVPILGSIPAGHFMVYKNGVLRPVATLLYGCIYYKILRAFQRFQGLYYLSAFLHSLISI